MAFWLADRLLGGFARFPRSDSGSLVVAVALSAPVLAIFTVCAVELSFVANDKSKTKDIADAAAIYGAQQYSSAPSGAAQRTQAFALSQLAALQTRSSVTAQASVGNDGAVTVQIDTQRDSFFGNVLPAGGFHTTVSSTAVGAATQPLCVLSTDTSAPANDLHLTAQSKMEAGKCLIQSDRNLVADAGAAFTGAAMNAVGSATGSMTPQANVGAKAISDPFASLALTAPSSCNSETLNISGNTTLQPGLHCGSMSVGSAGVATLAPGVHWFQNDVNLNNKGVLDGSQGVAVVFMNGAHLNVSGNISVKNVNLHGAKTGPLAGFVLLTARNYTGTFTLQSDAIGDITGVVYSPTAKLVIDGTIKAGATSPWTVIVAKGLTLNRSVDVVVNADYASSDVPVPKGVGPSTQGGTRMIK